MSVIDLLPPIKNPDGTFRIIAAVFDVWRAILLFRWTVFGVFILGFMAYGTIENMIKYDDRIVEHNIDDSRMLYKIWTPGCSIITDSAANVVQRSATETQCILSAEQMSSAVKKYEKSSAIKYNPSSIIWTYIFVFVWFFGVLNLIDPVDEPNYNSTNVFDSFLVGWLVISILLFPLTFRDHPFNADVRVDNIDISVSAVYLTNNRDGYYFTSPTYMGKISSNFTYATLN